MNNKSLLSIVTLLFAVVALRAQSPYPVQQNEVLFEGFDPITYFEEEIEEGSPEITTEYEGRLIYFVSESNKQKFLEDPEKYFPVHGGWCSFSMVNGKFVYPDYTMYKIQDGQLLFFATRAFFNAQTAWQQDPNNNKVAADKNYQMYFGQQ